MAQPNSRNLPMQVITVNPATGETEETRTCDFGHHSTREWLTKHVFWAWYQGKGVAINPLPPGTEVSSIR